VELLAPEVGDEPRRRGEPADAMPDAEVSEQTAVVALELQTLRALCEARRLARPPERSAAAREAASREP
jgi:hypothetical protein